MSRIFGSSLRFEVLGSLVPSVCLAIITIVGGVSNSTLDPMHGDQNKSFVSSSILILVLTLQVNFCNYNYVLLLSTILFFFSVVSIACRLFRFFLFP